MKTILKLLLSPATALYALVIFARNKLFDFGLFPSRKTRIPVVSVGNISMGGTGKTPLVDYLAKHYLRYGLQPAILSRGYKRKTKGVQLVSDGRTIFLGSREAGDESAMLAHKNPEAIVVVAEKRKKGFDAITKHFARRLPDVIVLDDGFQHRQLKRKLDIVVVNTAAPFFCDSMIPAGRLREPRRNIARADLIVLNKITDPQEAERFSENLKTKEKPVVKTRIKAGTPVHFAGPDTTVFPEKALAVAAIGQPESFLDSLQESGIWVVSHSFFTDHREFPTNRMRKLLEQAKKENLSLVTTEKDYFRIIGNRKLLKTILSLRVPCFYLPVEIEIIEGKEVLKKMLDEVVTGAS